MEGAIVDDLEDVVLEVKTVLFRLVYAVAVSQLWSES